LRDRLAHFPFWKEILLGSDWFKPGQREISLNLTEGDLDYSLKLDSKNKRLKWASKVEEKLDGKEGWSEYLAGPLMNQSQLIVAQKSIMSGRE